MLKITLALSNKSYLWSIFLHSDSVLHPCPLLAFPSPTPLKGRRLLLGASWAVRRPLAHRPWPSKPSTGNSSKGERALPPARPPGRATSVNAQRLGCSFILACHLHQLFQDLPAQLPPAQRSSWEWSKADGAEDSGKRVRGQHQESVSPPGQQLQWRSLSRATLCLRVRRKWRGPGLHISEGATSEASLSLPIGVAHLGTHCQPWCWAICFSAAEEVKGN